MLRFHVDAARPYGPRDKGKVERRIGDGRLWLLPPARLGLADVEALQAWTDEQVEVCARERRFSATGMRVAGAFEEERRHLGALSELPEPFGVVAQRRVGIDATVRFEGRTYGVPLVWAARMVELRGCTRTVQCLGRGTPRGRAPATDPGPDPARSVTALRLSRDGRGARPRPAHCLRAPTGGMTESDHLFRHEWGSARPFVV